jgi:hypothetical protein
MLSVAQAVHGCAAGTFTIARSGNPQKIPITSRMLGSVEVSFRVRGPDASCRRRRASIVFTAKACARGYSSPIGSS